jgi:hypothetical protein
MPVSLDDLHKVIDQYPSVDRDIAIDRMKQNGWLATDEAESLLATAFDEIRGPGIIPPRIAANAVLTAAAIASQYTPDKLPTLLWERWFIDREITNYRELYASRASKRAIRRSRKQVTDN